MERLLLFAGLKIFIKGARKRWMRMSGVCTTILMSSIYVAKSRKHLRKVVPWNDLLHLCKLFPIKFSCLQNEQVLLLFPFPLWVNLIFFKQCAPLCMSRIANPIHCCKQKINQSFCHPLLWLLSLVIYLIAS